MSEQRAEDLTKSAGDQTGEPQPPAANQGKDEPIASPTESPQPSDTGDVGDVHVNPPAPPGKPDGEVDTRA